MESDESIKNIKIFALQNYDNSGKSCHSFLPVSLVVTFLLFLFSGLYLFMEETRYWNAPRKHHKIKTVPTVFILVRILQIFIQGKYATNGGISISLTALRILKKEKKKKKKRNNKAKRLWIKFEGPDKGWSISYKWSSWLARTVAMNHLLFCPTSTSLYLGVSCRD